MSIGSFVLQFPVCFAALALGNVTTRLWFLFYFPPIAVCRALLVPDDYEPGFFDPLALGVMVLSFAAYAVLAGAVTFWLSLRSTPRSCSP